MDESREELQTPPNITNAIERVINTVDPLTQFLAAHYMIIYNTGRINNPVTQNDIYEDAARYVEEHTQIESGLEPHELQEMQHIPNEMRHELAAAIAKVCCPDGYQQAMHFFDEIVEVIKIDATTRNIFIDKTFIPIPQGNEFRLVAIGTPRNGLEQIDNTTLASYLRKHILNLNLNGSAITTINGESFTPQQNRQVYEISDNIIRTAQTLLFVDTYAQVIERLLNDYASRNGIAITNNTQELSDISLLAACACVLPTIKLAYEDTKVRPITVLELVNPKRQTQSSHPLYSQYALFKFIKFLKENTLSNDDLLTLQNIRLGQENISDILQRVKQIDNEMRRLQAELERLHRERKGLISALQTPESNT